MRFWRIPPIGRIDNRKGAALRRGAAGSKIMRRLDRTWAYRISTNSALAGRPPEPTLSPQDASVRVNREVAIFRTMSKVMTRNGTTRGAVKARACSILSPFMHATPRQRQRERKLGRASRGRAPQLVAHLDTFPAWRDDVNMVREYRPYMFKCRIEVVAIYRRIVVTVLPGKAMR